VKRFLIGLLIVLYIAELLWGLTLYHVIQWNIHITRN